MEQNKKDLLFEQINKISEVISTLSENFSQEVTLPRYHALEQSNHPCHGRLTFLHDNIITFNVFKISYALPQ